MTELQIFEQLKRKYDAEMVSALVGAGFTKNAYAKALSWTGLLVDLVEDAYKDELQDMYQHYVHQRFGVDVEPYEKLKEDFIKRIITRDGYLDVDKLIEMGFMTAPILYDGEKYYTFEEAMKLISNMG